MLPEQQRILGYFIEEAGDHLNTIEQGLLNLQATIEDSEMLNEVFRAAHSVKGGAAMLGLGSIQQIAHRLEDGFKLLKENPVRVDRELESLFLRIFDALQELLDQLQSPTGLTDAAAQQIMSGVEPVFGQLSHHLEMLLDGQVDETTDQSGFESITAMPITTTPTFATQNEDDEESAAMQLIFQSDVLARLREMLQLFKQPDSPQTRDQLVQICRLLARAGEQFDLASWVQLLQAVEQAISNPNNTFSTLASISIKEIKQAQELVLANRSAEIAVGSTLEELLPAPSKPDLEPDFDLEDLLEMPSEQADNLAQPDLDLGIEPDLDFDDLLDIPPNSTEPPQKSDLWEELDNSTSDLANEIDIEPPISTAQSKPHHARGPAVGQEELNTLADLFEDEAPELEAWEEVPDIISGFDAGPMVEDLDGDISESDLAEFLFDDDLPQQTQPPQVGGEDDFDLFGFDFDGEESSNALEELDVPETPPAGASVPTESEPLMDFLEGLDDGEEGDLFSDPLPSLTQETSTGQEPTPEGANEWSELWDESEIATTALEIEETSDSESEIDFDEFFDINTADSTDNSTESNTNPDLDLSFDDLFSSDAPPEESQPPTHELEDVATDLFDGDSNIELSSAETDDAEDSLDFFEGFDLDASEADDAQDLSAEGQALEELFSDTESDTVSESFSLSAEERSDTDLSELFGLELPEEEPQDTTEEILDFDWEPEPDSDASEVSIDDLLGEVSEDVDVSELFDSDLSIELAQEESLDFDGLLEEDDSDASASAEPEEPETPAEFVPLELLLSLEPKLSGASVFGELEAYLDRPSVSDAAPSKRSSAPASPKTESNSDFDDLEKLLEETEKNAGSMPSAPKSRGGGESRTRSRRRGGAFEQTMRVPIKQLDDLSNLVGELVVSRNSLEQDQERLRQFLDNLLHQVQQLSDVGQRMQDLYERTLLEMALLASRQSRVKAAQNVPQNNSHSDAGEFEALEMDRFTDFHTQAQEIIELIVRVRESASDIEFLVDENDQITRQLRQTTTQLQEGLTRSRMVPFSQTADRLPRGVRDNAIKFGKQVELNIEGRDTNIDKMILEHLHDPLTHLVNNAIAHGIESPEVRGANNKPPTGRITVSAFHQGNQTIISVADDGAGIDAGKVKQKALQKGLITPEQAEKMTDLDVYDLLFLPGFSTRDKADDLAGRGVGMDVVNTKLTEIRGTVNTDSTLGRGTTFTIRLPLTLSISKALCCISERASIAFPMDGVAEVLDTFPQSRLVQDEKGQRCVPWRDQMVPFQPLQELFNYNRHLGRSRYGGTTSTDDDTIAVVIVRSGATYLAVQVDQVMGEQEIVIKQLEGPVPKPMGIAGATVMGDGRIVPIADVLELIDLSMGRVRREANVSLWDDGEAPVKPIREKTEPTVLIIDDSITVRELLSMTFKKAGYRVEQARDGQEAWDKLRSGIPCELVFCDMEMPRMNGMELLSRMHKDSHLSQLPIAMLTSRTAEKHKQMAIELGARGYFTKPYLEEVLLDAAQRMLKGEVLVGAKPQTAG